MSSAIWNAFSRFSMKSENTAPWGSPQELAKDYKTLRGLRVEMLFEKARWLIPHVYSIITKQKQIINKAFIASLTFGAQAERVFASPIDLFPRQATSNNKQESVSRISTSGHAHIPIDFLPSRMYNYGRQRTFHAVNRALHAVMRH